MELSLSINISDPLIPLFNDTADTDILNIPSADTDTDTDTCTYLLT